MDEELELALLESVWIMRWNKDKTSMTAILTEDEAEQMCEDIVNKLKIAGFEIVRKRELLIAAICLREGRDAKEKIKEVIKWVDKFLRLKH